MRLTIGKASVNIAFNPATDTSAPTTTQTMHAAATTACHPSTNPTIHHTTILTADHIVQRDYCDDHSYHCYYWDDYFQQTRTMTTLSMTTCHCYSCCSVSFQQMRCRLRLLRSRLQLERPERLRRLLLCPPMLKLLGSFGVQTNVRAWAAGCTPSPLPGKMCPIAVLASRTASQFWSLVSPHPQC